MLQKILLTVIVVPALFLFGCSKETVNKEVNTARETCFEFISKDPELSCFQAAIDRIDLAKDPDYLQKGPFSFFVPTDAAFAKAGLNKQAIINYDKEELRQIINGHILNGRLGSATVAGFYRIGARCLDNTYKPILSRNYYGLFLNGNKSVASTDLGDGMVHKLEGVAFPGTTNLWQFIKNDERLSILTAAIELTVVPPGQPDFGSDLKKLLETGMQLGVRIESTVLCPTDAAFHTLGYQTQADLNRLSVSQLRLLLLQHVLSDYKFTSDFLMDGTLVPGSRTLTLGKSIIYPELIQTNIKASNGVAHIIDQVILP